MTLTVEDLANDGARTFMLNDMEVTINSDVTVEPEVTNKVTNVPSTPSESNRNDFYVTVEGRADKVQIVEPDGGTRTYHRNHEKVTIKSYNAAGEEVGSLDRALAYEIWTLTDVNLPDQRELTVYARYGYDWSIDAPYVFTVTLKEHEYDDEVYSMELAATEGLQGKVSATVVTGLDVTGVRFVMDNGTTATYYTSAEQDGKLTYTGAAWINHKGDNVIKVKIRVNNAWYDAGELTYYGL